MTPDRFAFPAPSGLHYGVASFETADFGRLLRMTGVGGLH
jgi:hypothetical protein